jgi:subtilisin family serine protease
MSNTGTQLARPEAWAKNVIAVGGIVHNDTPTRADDAPGGSATGPASDGRIKPDVAHVFDAVTTLAPAPPPSQYTQFAGTSASTSIVAGHIGLICQLWHEGVFAGFGGGPSVFDDRPRAATIRALLINSAYQYDWFATIPMARFKQGWGMPDLAALLDRADRTFVVNETDVLGPGGVKTYTLTVPAGEPALKATMTYLDPAGSPAVQSQHRVNDLTLKVTSPDGTVYWGNTGLASGVWSQPGGVPDTMNVIENVFIQNPAPGPWQFEVRADEVVMDAHLETPQVDADFALVVSGVEPGTCYPDCNADGVLDVQDFGCFTNAFINASPYADCNADGVLDTTDFGCFVNAFIVGCP